MLKFLIEH